jgi:uracil-DNA glycosylase family 4
MDMGFATGTYAASPDDGLALIDCMISNAVRCAPPGNKTTPAEEAACRRFLIARIAELPRLKVIIALGEVARRNVVRAFGLRPPPSGGHGAELELAGVRLLASYHCSRLNTNTGRLTEPMFRAVFERARQLLATAP